MRFAYADPPYLGLCYVYGHEHGDGGCWDELETHRALLERLEAFDGWALSLSVPSLRSLLPLMPEDVRVLAWTKLWSSWKPGVWPAYAWEPVIIRGARGLGRERPTPRDWYACHVTTGAGFEGAKPEAVIRWLLECLGVRAEDDFIDLFHGSGAVSRAYDRWRAQLPLEAGPKPESLVLEL